MPFFVLLKRGSSYLEELVMKVMERGRKGTALPWVQLGLAQGSQELSGNCSQTPKWQHWHHHRWKWQKLGKNSVFGVNCNFFGGWELQGWHFNQQKAAAWLFLMRFSSLQELRELRPTQEKPSHRSNSSATVTWTPNFVTLSPEFCNLCFYISGFLVLFLQCPSTTT